MSDLADYAPHEHEIVWYKVPFVMRWVGSAMGRCLLCGATFRRDSPDGHVTPCEGWTDTVTDNGDGTYLHTFTAPERPS